MATSTSGLVHPAIAAVANDALRHLGSDPLSQGQAGPVTSHAQRASLARILEIGGPSALFLAGRRFERFQEYPLFLVLLNSESVPVLLDKIADVNRYLHSHHRHEVREEGAHHIELDHVSIRGPAPKPQESLFVAGLYVAIMEQIGCVGLRTRFPLSDGPTEGPNGPVFDAPLAGTSRWRVEWDDMTARRPLPGLDQLLLREPGQDLEAISLANQVSWLVDRDLSRHWSLRTIADELLMSPRTLQRHLHAEGTTFTGVLTDRRIAEARRLLDTTSTPITDIGYMLGFSDTPHFTRTFTGAMGTPPSKWRRRRSVTG